MNINHSKDRKANKKVYEPINFRRPANNVTKLLNKSDEEAFHESAITMFENEGGRIITERYENFAS